MRGDVRDFFDTGWRVFLRTDGVRRAKPTVCSYWFGKAAYVERRDQQDFQKTEV